MNVIIVIIDALRPDHLGVNGYHRDTSPNIDKLAEEGTLFLNTYCTLPRSDASITSMMTGMYPHSHGVRLLSNNKINSSVDMLSEILQSHGYKTAFIKQGGIFPEGYDKRFMDYDMLTWKIKNKIKRGVYKLAHKGNFLGIAEQCFSTAIDWVKKNSDKKFFLVVHTNDIHWPYAVPEPYNHMFDANYKGSHIFSDLGAGISRGDITFGVKKLSQEEINHAIAHYDGGICYADAHLKRFLDALKMGNIYEDTLLLIVSDHGEHLGEHGYYFQHGASLYEQSVKSTLIIRYPKKIPKNKKIESRVQVLDIMPTILDILDIPILDKIEGVSLLPLILGKTQKARDFIFTECIEEHFKQHKRIFMKGIKGKWRMMIVDDWKIIYIPHPEKNIFELYNLKNDPEEKNDLIDKEKDIALQMEKKILDFLKQQSNEGDADLSSLTEKSKELLIKLGYLEKE